MDVWIIIFYIEFFQVARNCTIPGLLFNAKYGFLDGRLRGYIDDLLSETDYSILAECPTLDDVVSYLNTPEQTRLSRYGVSHAHPTAMQLQQLQLE